MQRKSDNSHHQALRRFRRMQCHRKAMAAVVVTIHIGDLKFKLQDGGVHCHRVGLWFEGDKQGGIALLIVTKKLPHEVIGNFKVGVWVIVNATISALYLVIADDDAAWVALLDLERGGLRHYLVSLVELRDC